VNFFSTIQKKLIGEVVKRFLNVHTFKYTFLKIVSGGLVEYGF